MATRSQLSPYNEPRPHSILWITNLAAPYRIPVWQSVQKSFPLRVGLLESRSSLAADKEANRGPDWSPSHLHGIDFFTIPTIKLKRGEARYYFPRRLGSVLLPRDSSVVIFGGWESPIYWLLLLSAKLFGTGCVAFYESTLNTMRHKRGLVSWIRQSFFRAMDAIVVPGPAAGNALVAMGVPPNKILEGFNAVDVRAFQEAKGRKPHSSDIGHAFIYVGQLIPRKRVAHIVDAFASIARLGDTLTIVGSGEQAQEIRDQAKDHKNISFLPYVSNEFMPDLMSIHNTLVLASSEEVWGLVVNEALASGLHAVVSESCGVVQSVKSMAGVLVASPGLENLAEKMEESRSNWTGPLSDPEILRFTPEEFAGVFVAAAKRSIQSRQAKSRILRRRG